MRGIASKAGDSYAEVYAERTPLYRHHADLTVDASAGSPDAVAAQILQLLSQQR
jgi:shikimate kinase